MENVRDSLIRQHGPSKDEAYGVSTMITRSKILKLQEFDNFQTFVKQTGKKRFFGKGSEVCKRNHI